MSIDYCQECSTKYDTDTTEHECEKYPHLEQKAKQAIDAAKKMCLENGAEARVIMMVDGFQTDDEAIALLYMLWYARDNGVVIEMVPRGYSRVADDMNSKNV